MSSVGGIDSGRLKSFRDCDVAVVRGWVLVLSSPRSHRHVPHGAASGPVPLARLAEIAGLVNVVVVVVAELGVHAVAARTRQNFVWLLQCFVVVVFLLIVLWLVVFWLCRFFVYGRCIWVLNTLWRLRVCSIWRRISFFRFLTNFFSSRILIIWHNFFLLMKCILRNNNTKYLRTYSQSTITRITTTTRRLEKIKNILLHFLNICVDTWEYRFLSG